MAGVSQSVGEIGCVDRHSLHEDVQGGPFADQVSDGIPPDDPVPRPHQPSRRSSIKEIIHLRNDGRPGLAEYRCIAGRVVIETLTFEPVASAILHLGMNVVAVGTGVGFDPAIGLERKPCSPEERPEQARIAVHELAVGARSRHGDARDVKAWRRVVHPLDAFAIGAVNVRVFAEHLARATPHGPQTVQAVVAGGELAQELKRVESLNELE